MIAADVFPFLIKLIQIFGWRNDLRLDDFGIVKTSVTDVSR